MTSHKYYSTPDMHRSYYSDTLSEDYSEIHFLKSMPDENATVGDVTYWMGSGDNSRYAASNPDWLRYANFDGYSISKLSLTDLIRHQNSWGVEFGAAEWLAERIVFARGLRAGVKEYLANELRQEILPEFVDDMRTEIQDEMKNEIRDQFTATAVEALKTNVKDEVREDLKEEIKDALREELDDEDTIALLKEEMMNEIREQIRAEFGEDVIGQMRKDVKDQVKKDVRQVLKMKFKGSIITGMKYEIMEDMKECVSYILSEEPHEENLYLPAEPGVRGIKRRKC